MAVAGYLCTVKLSGTSTAYTAEGATLVSGTTYRINTAAKRVLDPAAAITVKDAGTPLAADAFTVDYLFGTVTLDSAPGGAVTVDASYFPLWAVAEGNAVSISCARDELESTIYGNTAHEFTLGLGSASGDIKSFDVQTTDLDTGGGTTLKVQDVFNGSGPSNGANALLEVYLGSAAALSYFRSWVVLPGLDLEAQVAGLVGATVKWRSTTLEAASRDERVSFGFGTSP